MSDPIRIGLLGAGWITRAHGHALHTLNHVTPLARPIELAALAARNPDRGAAMARDLGIERFTTDWREVVDDPDIDVIAVLLGETAHLEATDAALALGKPVLCEKPLGRDRFEAAAMLDAARRAGVHAAVGFNYRYMPAMRLARDIVVQRPARTVPAVPGGLSPGPCRRRPCPSRKPNVSRAITDYCHIIDFMRYLGNEAEAVQAVAAKLTPADIGVDLEDAYVAAVELRGGGIASLEASRVAWGWKGRQGIEFNGTEGSLWWDMEDLNRLHVFYAADEADGTGGFRDILVSQPEHPFMDMWWPPGHTVGWEHSFAHEWRDFLTAVIDDRRSAVEQASFEDGYQAALMCDAVITAATEQRRVTTRRDGGVGRRQRRPGMTAARELGIGMVGAGTMAGAHSLALSMLAPLYADLPIRPRLVVRRRRQRPAGVPPRRALRLRARGRRTGVRSWTRPTSTSSSRACRRRTTVRSCSARPQRASTS